MGSDEQGFCLCRACLIELWLVSVKGLHALGCAVSVSVSVLAKVQLPPHCKTTCLLCAALAVQHQSTCPFQDGGMPAKIDRFASLLCRIGAAKHLILNTKFDSMCIMPTIRGQGHFKVDSAFWCSYLPSLSVG